jgi:hypothetical protein
LVGAILEIVATILKMKADNTISAAKLDEAVAKLKEPLPPTGR